MTMNTEPAGGYNSTAGDDPIFAAIENHRRAWRSGNDKCDDVDDDTFSNTWSLMEEKAFSALCETIPTTAAGVAALAAYIAENGEGEDGEDRGDGSIYDSRPVRLSETIAKAAARMAGRAT